MLNQQMMPEIMIPTDVEMSSMPCLRFGLSRETKISMLLGAVIAIQSFGDFLGFNSHLHVLASDGCFYGEGMFRPALARLIGF